MGQLRPRDRYLLLLGVVLVLQAIFVLRHISWVQPRYHRQVFTQMEGMQTQMINMQQDLKRTLDLISTAILTQDKEALMQHRAKLHAMQGVVEGAAAILATQQ